MAVRPSPSRRAPRSALPDAGEGEFDLATSLAYRLVILAERVSRAVAASYEKDFDLTRSEWRVLAALAANGAMAAKEIGPYSTLDKMQVSRVAQRLEAAGYIERQTDENDKRSNILRMTPGGRALYLQVRARVQAREAEILGALAPAERAALGDMLDRVQAQVGRLEQS